MSDSRPFAVPAVDQSPSSEEYDTAGFRSSFRTLIHRYSNLKGLRWPYNSGVTARLSEQEIEELLENLQAQKKLGNEMAGLVSARIQIWRFGKTQDEAADFLGLNDAGIRELDKITKAISGPMWPRKYNHVPLQRTRKWRLMWPTAFWAESYLRS